MAPEKPAKRYLSADDIAAELDVTVDTVRRWLRNGDLKGILLSRQAGYRITREDLDKFLSSRQPNHPDE